MIDQFKIIVFYVGCLAGIIQNSYTQQSSPYDASLSSSGVTTPLFQACVSSCEFSNASPCEEHQASVPCIQTNRKKRNRRANTAVDEVSCSMALAEQCCKKRQCLRHLTLDMIQSKRKENLGVYSKTTFRISSEPSSTKGGDTKVQVQPEILFVLRKEELWKTLIALRENGASWPLTVKTPSGGEIQLCIDAWCVYNGFAPSTVRGYLKLIDDGVKCFSTRKTVKGMTKLASEAEKHSLIVQWILKQASDKAGMGADLMPTSDGAIHLPLYNKKSAYLEYCKDIQSQPSMIPCYSYFNQVWRTAVELEKIKTQRKGIPQITTLQ